MAPHRGPSPPKSPAQGARWFDTDSRNLHEWREGKGWVIVDLLASPELEEAVPPAPPKLRSRIPPPICSDCGGERSAGSGQRCKRCFDAASAAKRAERAVPWREKLIGQAEAPAKPVSFERDWAALLELLGTVRFIASLAPPTEPPKAREVEFEPPPPPRRDPTQDHPVIARHASRPHPPRDPLARRERSKPEPDSHWSPEFQAQLDKVAAGAGLVDVIPIRRAEPLYTLGGVSETGI